MKTIIGCFSINNTGELWRLAIVRRTWMCIFVSEWTQRRSEMKHVLKQDSCVLATTFSFMPRLDDVTLLTRKRNYFAFHAVNRFNAIWLVSVRLFHLRFFSLWRAWQHSSATWGSDYPRPKNTLMIKCILPIFSNVRSQYYIIYSSKPHKPNLWLEHKQLRILCSISLLYMV